MIINRISETQNLQSP